MRGLPLTLFAIATLVAGPVGAQSSADYAKAAKPGDDQLTCAQIMAEGMSAQTESMDLANIDLPPDVEARVRATAKAGGAAANILGLAALASAFVPGAANAANALIGQGMAASGRATQAAIHAQTQAAYAKKDAAFDSALDRMSYLQAMYREKCARGVAGGDAPGRDQSGDR